MHTEQTDLVRVAAGSRKNRYPDKPYEDALWLGPTSHVFCVVDGITRSRVDGEYPNPSPASYVATAVVSAVASTFNGEHSLRELEPQIVEALRRANRRVHDYVYGKTNGPSFSNDDIPGAVATILALEDSYAVFAHLGDCAILHFPEGDLSRPVRLTDDQTAGARQWLIETTSVPWEAKLQILRTSIRNVRKHPLAFGVLSGQDEALDFLQTGRIKIASRDKLLMCTDGLESILTNVKGDLHLQRMIAQGDIEGIMDYADHLDQTFKKRSDDKTLIIIDIQG